MLFSAGMGIGLMYFGVGEPMQHYSSEVFELRHYSERGVYYPKVYFDDGREGYDRFLDIVSEENNEMFISSNANNEVE